jgi:hypothetical protein
MASYTLTAVRSTDFTGADGTNIETLVAWLDAFPSTSGGYYAVTTNKCKLEFSASEVNGLADVTGSYTEDQYVVGRVGDLSEAGITGRYLGAFLHCTGASSAGTTASYYRLEISQDNTTTPLVTRVMRVTSGSAVQIASINNVTWVNGDRFLFVDYSGTIEVYRDSGSGFGSTPILSVDDTGSRLSGGGPGLIIRTPDSHTLDDLEMGDATLSADTTPPTLSSPTGTGGLGVCSGTVSTNEGNGTLRAVATASATQPSVAQIKAGQDHTGAAALRAVSQSVAATGTQTVASGAISGGAGTRYLHYLHTDAASNDSNRVSSASFEVTAAATSLVVTVPDAAGQSGFAAAVLSTAAPTTGSTVIRTATSLTFNGSGQVTIDITGLGIAVGAYRWVTLTNSNGTPSQSPAPVAASGPVIAS